MRPAIAVLLLVPSAFAWGIDAGEIIARMEDNQVHATAAYEGSITISDGFGVRTKTFRAFSMGKEKMLVEFTNPEEAGQKILRSGDEIYLYYPEAEEVIRLQGSALRDSVMGSDFSYEDLTGEKGLLDLYNVALEGTENLDGRDCFVLKLTAKKKGVAYPLQRMWVDAAEFVTRKASYFALSGKVVKEMEVKEIRVVSGKSVPTLLAIRDLMKGRSSTIFRIDKIAIDVPMDPRTFSLEELSW
jgi:outer membrane lipoprotein-sorting protein